ncbi:ROK family transcriptional regulator [Streptomyces sp. B93]|uniref:ROK family transcriptional regulator n=1 Tax=Streptomyces sp. B93 TaxID=2824875 RepID=UPI001B366632|nr:ROK family transcriptional regulator [Streptomyces sp. B93]MBQ1093324.1 ROK family transcriptional regulator [Streptomyces sp. B93]
MQMPTGVHALVRRTHEERVLRALQENGAMSRGEIARVVGLSRTTLSEITGNLLQRGAIVVVDTDASRREGSGRPAERLALDPASAQFMGVDFGHRRVHVVVADASHEIMVSGSVRYDDAASWQTRTGLALDLVERLTTEAGVHFGALQGIGIGVPGPYPALEGAAWPRATSVGTVLRPAPEGVDVAFAERFDAPVIVDNNTRLAALAEAISGVESVADLVYVRLSDGVGGGLVVGGHLVTGSAGLAGELGHVTVEPAGRPCRCGKRGCLETVASVPAILAACWEFGLRLESLRDLADAVARAHPVADRVLREAAGAVGRVVGAATMALNPAKVVIGGEIAQLAPVLVEQVAVTLAGELFPTSSAGPVVEAARLSDDDGAIGALAAVFHSSPLLARYPETAGPQGDSGTRDPLSEGTAHVRP